MNRLLKTFVHLQDSSLIKQYYELHISESEFSITVAGQENQTEITELYLMGFVGLGDLQVPAFCLFLLIYLVTMVGNILIILLVVTDSHLHIPMYFFLGNFSFLEICYSSNILPMMLASLIHGGRKLISITGCIIQYYLFALLAIAECCLLAAMSYDRYVAICKPLHYTTLMNDKICVQFIVGSWIHGFFVMNIVLYLMHLLKLKFCGPSEINHFFCELNPVLKLACGETYLIEIATTLLSVLCVLLPFLLTLTSYVFIISTVMRMSSVSGRKKAFSTCSSHLMVVSIFYITLMIVYILPKTDDLKRINKIVSLFYTILPPLLNPLIYSLRNREVIEALRKAVAKLHATERMYH
ncbi:olfactory receptor 10C1-like [Protobothrops mucrosquamatus]|uniref:olfactory receptor 10C1-like n=1 Tax=Protobothrops mucrosquamatus TaxID=103944 RepID=UPI000775848C|nr:olfactory receptor 10C1-like [Protobothrops mucrosquamatus]